ncbi:hypothetical protein HK101_011618 [Irineochytrium annulatum]|nr:hypothetical protein HK101_011618 [Irineochytrium annulatum]
MIDKVTEETAVKVVVIGAGAGGIIVGHGLITKGVQDFVILEKSTKAGGTWWDNQYPGCGCDVPSHLYSFSFNLNPNWTRLYSRQTEINAYMVDTTKKFGIDKKIRLGVEVTRTEWDDDRKLWLVSTISHPSGTSKCYTCQVLVGAYGGLHIPKYPDIPGLDTFKGKLVHTARWPEKGPDGGTSEFLRGKRVAVIGSGATAVQLVPAIQPSVGRMTVYQRTPNWVPIRKNTTYSGIAKWIFRNVPGAMWLQRVRIFLMAELVWSVLNPRSIIHFLATFEFKRQLRMRVKDATLRKKLEPKQRVGCKRITPSADFYETLQKDNVELVADGIVKIDEGGIVDATGKRTAVDVIICATGFDVTNPASKFRVPCYGRGGKELGQVWKEEGTNALRSTTVHGFPNLLLMTGPNSGSGHISQLHQMESQGRLITPLALEVVSGRFRTFEARADAQRKWNEIMQKGFKGTVWTSEGCKSWYQDSKGRIVVLWPGYATRFRREMRIKRGEYISIDRIYPVTCESTPGQRPRYADDDDFKTKYMEVLEHTTHLKAVSQSGRTGVQKQEIT